MAYLNKIDVNGRTYYLQHLTDGKNEAMLPVLEKDAMLIVQDSSTTSGGGNIGTSSKPVYIEKNKVKASSSSIGSETQHVYMKYGTITASTRTVGSNTKPIYMNAGNITEFSETIGSGIHPVYVNDGEITVSNSTVGSGITPVYMQEGVITASNETVGTSINPVYMSTGKIVKSDATVGSNIKPVYMNDGNIIESNATVGSGIKPVYMNGGEITESSETVGSAIKPVYLNAGAITVSNGNVGSEIIPVYMTNGTITQTTKTVGSGIKPIYMDNGTITASASTVGAINQPVYMNNGEVTACSDNVGSANVPVYMANGVITACGTIPITSGGTGATTKEKALENFGLTATAAELNTLDGITATVTELNYVDGVTSNIQTQFNGHETRIATMETFFKEADIDASQEFIDTLKEIQTYIADDKTGAAAMAKSIGDNKSAIDTEKIRAEGAEADLQSQITVEAKTARDAEKANADAIAILNGSDNGSVAKAVADARTAIELEIAKKVDKVDGKGLSTNDYSDAEKEKLEGIETGANKYIHPSHNACTSGLYKITVDEFGHVSNVVAVSKEDIVALGIPAQDTTYGLAVATTEDKQGADGLLSEADKTKYDGYEATIASLLKRIDDLEKLVMEYHPLVEPEETE